MHELSTPSLDAVSFYETEFGVARRWLERLTYHERGDEVWATSASDIPPLDAPRLPGLRILRRTPHGLKPTSVFLALLGDRITKRRAEVNLEDLHSLLLGQWIPIDLPDGFAAIVFEDDVLGCGRASHGRVHALIPTGRRRELLGAISRP